MKVAVIGATGRLAPMVINEMIKNGITVKALVRNKEKAASVLHSGVNLVQADIEDVQSLVNGLKDIDYVYLNLSTNFQNSKFQPEYDGIRNILTACEQNNVKRIFKISGLGAYRKDFAQGKTIFVNEIRIKGHELMKNSKIPYTLFHATWFMESLPLMFQQGNKLNAFKPINHPLYWIAGKDYAKMVVKAILQNMEGNKDYVIQGKEAITMHDALERYAQTFSPALKVAEAPIGLLKFLGFFIPKIKVAAMMGEYFKDFKEELVAEETWRELGKPTHTLETFRDKNSA
jgi:uncharacterized protein YbjT (DUF2867 family)